MQTIALILSLMTTLLFGASFGVFAVPTRAVGTPTLAAPGVGVDITFVGDVMMDRNIRKALPLFTDPAGPFAAVASLLHASAITVGNLEGTITHHRSRVSPRNLQFTFDPSTAGLLSRAGFNVVSLANNHAHDFGVQGLKDTKQALTDVAIPYFGDPKNDPTSFNMIPGPHDMDIVFVGFQEAPWRYDEKPTLAAIRARRKACATMTPLRPCFIVVYPHWGIEYQRQPSQRQRTLGRAFIDAGADMIVGSHPHVVQPFEIYRGKPIFYSLGNFLFDQWFSRDTTEGLMLRMTMEDAALAIELVPTVIHRDASVRRAPAKDAVRQLAWLSKNATGKKGSYTLDGAVLRIPR